MSLRDKGLCCAPLLGVVFLAASLSALFTTATMGNSTNFTVASALVAATNGNANALYFLARCYANGEGVPRDSTNAAFYMLRAAELNHAAAQNDLGAYYAKGLGVRESLDEAAKWYHKAAENGDGLGQYSLGRAYAEGRGLPTNIQESIKWLEKSAEQKQPDATLYLGELFFHGAEGLPINCREALGWFRKARDLGRVEALNEMGLVFERGGGGVDADAKQAVVCFREAAEQGDARAQMNLGRMYFDAVGVKLDFAEAYKWYYLSTKNGDLIARHYLEELQGNNIAPAYRLTPQQMAEAERQANEIDRQFQRNKQKKMDNKL